MGSLCGQTLTLIYSWTTTPRTVPLIGNEEMIRREDILRGSSLLSGYYNLALPCPLHVGGPSDQLQLTKWAIPAHDPTGWGSLKVMCEPPAFPYPLRWLGGPTLKWQSLRMDENGLEHCPNLEKTGNMPLVDLPTEASGFVAPTHHSLCLLMLRSRIHKTAHAAPGISWFVCTFYCSLPCKLAQTWRTLKEKAPDNFKPQKPWKQVGLNHLRIQLFPPMIPKGQRPFGKQWPPQQMRRHTLARSHWAFDTLREFTTWPDHLLHLGRW